MKNAEGLTPDEIDAFGLRAVAGKRCVAPFLRASADAAAAFFARPLRSSGVMVSETALAADLSTHAAGLLENSATSFGSSLVMLMAL